MVNQILGCKLRIKKEEEENLNQDDRTFMEDNLVVEKNNSRGGYW